MGRATVSKRTGRTEAPSARELIDALGMTNEALAQKLGMSERQIYNLRNGTTPLRKVVRLALERLGDLQ